MRNNILTLLIFLFSILIFNAQQFPTNFDADSLKTAKTNIDKWNGKLIATQCAIKEVKNGPKKKPYYKCYIDENNFIWVGSLMNDNQRLKIDETVRILGYFSKIEENDKISLKYNQEKYHLLSFATLNLTNKKAYHLPRTEIQFKEWQNGIINQTEN